MFAHRPLPSVRRPWQPPLAIIFLLGAVLGARADVRLPSVFGDHMVLQQNADVAVWGWAYEGETVLIETTWGVKTQTVADARGEWHIKIRTPQARPLKQGLHPEAIAFTVPHENMVQIKDVLIGEVWLCGGQSNMTMMLGPDYPAGNNGWYGDRFWPAESRHTDRPAIRVFNVEKTARAIPQDDCKAVLPDHITLPKNAQGLTPDLRTGWQICSPDTAPYISAVAYYFAARIQEQLDVPIGLVTSDVGGSPIQAWLSLDALHRVPGCESLTNRVHRLGAAALFNGMIAPLTPLSLRGVLWYQGESNGGDTSEKYAALLQALIADWRARFDQPNLPFGIVQLANYGKPGPGSPVALIRQAQSAVASKIPGTGLAVAIDLGEVWVHPPDKREVARRLSLWARATVYGETNLVFQSPSFRSGSAHGPVVHVRFTTGGSPLITGKRNGEDIVETTPEARLAGFELAGPNGIFLPADARIDGDSVVVASPSIAHPAAVRYAWADNPEGCNLYNRAGLPASPFTVTLSEQ